MVGMLEGGLTESAAGLGWGDVSTRLFSCVVGVGVTS